MASSISCSGLQQEGTEEQGSENSIKQNWHLGFERVVGVVVFIVVYNTWLEK